MAHSERTLSPFPAWGLMQAERGAFRLPLTRFPPSNTSKRRHGQPSERDTVPPTTEGLPYLTPAMESWDGENLGKLANLTNPTQEWVRLMNLSTADFGVSPF